MITNIWSCIYIEEACFLVKSFLTQQALAFVTFIWHYKLKLWTYLISLSGEELPYSSRFGFCNIHIALLIEIMNIFYLINFVTKAILTFSIIYLYAFNYTKKTFTMPFELYSKKIYAFKKLDLINLNINIKKTIIKHSSTPRN